MNMSAQTQGTEKLVAFPNLQKAGQQVMVPEAISKQVKAVLASDKSKAEKIRQLHTIGGEALSQYKIAQLMGIIPQFVNNVLSKAKAQAEKKATKATTPAEDAAVTKVASALVHATGGDVK
jgi:hypothetical protein